MKRYSQWFEAQTQSHTRCPPVPWLLALWRLDLFFSCWDRNKLSGSCRSCSEMRQQQGSLFVPAGLELVYISSDADLPISPNSNLALMVNNWSYLVLIGSRVLTVPQKLTCRGNWPNISIDKHLTLELSWVSQPNWTSRTHDLSVNSDLMKFEFIGVLWKNPKCCHVSTWHHSIQQDKIDL